MRPALILTALLSALPAAAVAQPHGAAAYAAGEPEVHVSIGPQLADRARRVGIDEGDFERLQKDLRDEAANALRRAGPNAPVRADLVIYDAVPNRPTQAQYGREVSLSMASVGLGGAEVRGTVIFADGRTAPVRYRFYETDIRQELAADTWYDADRAFLNFGANLRRGRLAEQGWGEAGPNAGAFGRPNSY